MKRLQLRHHDEIFESRSLALEFFNNIVDLSHTASTVFGKSLYAEPMVAKYLDSESNVQLLFAIGVDSPNAPYHIIDSKEIYEKLKENENAILSEVERATSAETALNQAIEDNKTSIVPVEVSSSNVLEEFALKNALGEVLGSSIKIYKDSSLVGATTGFKGAKYVERKEDGSFVLLYDEATRDESIEYLYLIYKDENGELKLVSIDFENFLMEAEFGDGLKVINHVASIKIKEGEKYLESNKDGLQTVGIDKAINDAVNELSESVDEKLAILDTTLNTKIDNVKDTLSGNIITLDKKVDEQVENLDTKINTEIKTLDDKLSKTINDKETALKAEIKANKIHSKDVVLNESESGTTLEIQTDEITITKKADAGTIYDTNIAVLGSLLKIKKVKTDSASIKSRYELQGADGKLIGDAIELNVESALVDFRQGKLGAFIDPQTGSYTEGTGDITMDFIYRLEDGTYKLVQIEISKYFTDAHFGKGLNNQDGVVSLKEGDGNEYLVIGEDTISVVGINASIEKSKNEAIENSVSSANSYTDTIANGINANFETTKDFVISELETVSNVLSSQINSEIESVKGALSAETLNREASINSAISTASNMIANESSARANDIRIVNDFINEEITNRTIDTNDIRKILSAETESLRIEIDEAKSEAINNATTSATTEARKIAAEEVAKIVNGADTSYDTLKEIADWILNDTTGAAQMANDIKEIKTDINEINGEINTLNSDASVKGSVKNSVNEGINESMIFNTLPITNITPDEAFRNSSLIRKVIHEGKTYYYVSNKASEMSIETKEGTLVNLRDYVISLQETNGNLNTEILTLKSTIETLNNELSGLNETIKDLKEQIENGPGDSVNEEQVKEIIKNYLQGVTNEIQISESESKDKLTIGFADDAIFG